MNSLCASFFYKFRFDSKCRSRLLNIRKFMSGSSSKTEYVTNEGMQAWRTEGFYGLEGVNLVSSKIPVVIKPSEVLVKVCAASVNPLDTAMIGGYGNKMLKMLHKIEEFQTGVCNSELTEFPLTVGRDFVGEVMRVGHNVSKVKPKDKVWGVVMPHRPGSHADFVVTDSCMVEPKPKSLTNIEAASIPYVGLTGWSAAVLSGGLSPRNSYGKKVVLLGACGGVGSFLSQLMSSWGAHVTSVCSEDSFELALSLGASEVYDYRNPETIEYLTSKPMFDLVLDAAGLNEMRWMNGLKEWSNASYISLVSPLLKNTDKHGLLGGSLKSVFALLESNSSLSRGRIFKWAYFMPNEKALKEIGRMVEEGKMRPVVDKVFDLTEAKSAYEHMVSGPARGKTVIDFQSGRN